MNCVSNSSLEFNLNDSNLSLEISASLAFWQLGHRLITVYLWPPIFIFGVINNLLIILIIPRSVVRVSNSVKLYYLVIAISDLSFHFLYGIWKSQIR